MNIGSRRLNIIVITITVLIIGTSVLVTLIATGVLFETAKVEAAKKYQNVTLTDAVLKCRDEVIREYGDNIQNLTTDNHSSRFDNRQYLYKIYLNMDQYDGAKGTTQYFINCFVSSSDAKIRKYEVFKDEGKQESPRRVRDNTNMFGMPKRGD